MESLHQKFKETREFFMRNLEITKDINYGSVYIYKIKSSKANLTIRQHIYFLLCITEHLNTFDDFEEDEKQELNEINTFLNDLISKPTIKISNNAKNGELSKQDFLIHSSLISF